MSTAEFDATAYKVGDRVAVNSRGRHWTARIKAITPTGRVTLHECPGRQYNRDGSLRGATGWDNERLVPCTQEIRDEVAHRLTLSAIRGMIATKDLDRLPLVAIKEIAEVLAKHMKPETD